MILERSFTRRVKNEGEGGRCGSIHKRGMFNRRTVVLGYRQFVVAQRGQLDTKSIVVVKQYCGFK